MSSISTKKNICEFNDSFDNDTSLNKEETKSKNVFSSEALNNMFNNTRQLENPNLFEILNKNPDLISLSNEDDNRRYFIESPPTDKNYDLKNEDSKVIHEEEQNNLTKEKSFIGKKTKSNHQQEDAETIEINDNSDKKDESKNDKKSENEQNNINEFKQPYFCTFIGKILELSEKSVNFTKYLIFFLLVNIFVHSNDKNKENYEKNENFINDLETNFNVWKWKEILEKYFTVIEPNEENILFLKRILSIYEDKKNEPENKNAIELLGLTPFEYFKKVIDKGFGDQHNYSIDKRMIKCISKIIKCLIRLIEKKEIKEIKEGKLENNNINQNFIDSQSDNSDKNLDEELINNDFNNINENKVNNNNLQINDNNKSTKCASNDTNITKTYKIEKKIRRDNLTNVLKNMILKAFDKVFIGKSPKELIFFISKKKEEEKDFMDTNFDEYTKKFTKIKINEVEELRKTNKNEFLKEIMKDNENIYIKYISKEEFFQIDKDEQIRYFKNLKCKIKAIEIFKSNDLDGLILLTKLINIDQDYNIKIINSENFEKTIKILDFYKDFIIYLNFGYKDNVDNEDNLDKYITKRRDKLEEIINDIIQEKKAKINKFK